LYRTREKLYEGGRDRKDGMNKEPLTDEWKRRKESKKRLRVSET